MYRGPNVGTSSFKLTHNTHDAHRDEIFVGIAFESQHAQTRNILATRCELKPAVVRIAGKIIGHLFKLCRVKSLFLFVRNAVEKDTRKTTK